jgi:ribose transport system substrate-binding protein
MYFKAPRTPVLPRMAGVLAGAVSLALVLAACSSGGTSGNGEAAASGSVPAEVAQDLSTYSASSDLNYAGQPFDVSSVQGKAVWWVTQYSGNPFLATVGKNFKAAMHSVGVEVTECDGKGNPVDASSCLAQAVSHGAAAVQMDGPEPTTYANALPAAVSARVPVLAGAGVDASTPPIDGLTGISSQPFGLTGELAADWIIKDSGGKANVLFLTTPDVIGSKTEQEAFSAKLQKNCPDCHVSIKGVTLANWASDLGPTTSAELVKDPTINYVVPTFDPMTQFVNPAIQQTGKSASVKVVSVNGNLAFMQDMASGDSLTKALVGIDLNALGYIEADQVLRAMTGNEPLKLAYAPVRVFDTTSVGDLTLTDEAANDGSWYAGTGTTADFFATLWKRG